MTTKPPSKELAPQTADYIASAAKGFLGAAPFVGSLLAELVGNVIPNQRIDRIGRLAEKLEVKLGKLEQEFVKSQLTNMDFNDLFEEALRQASRATTEERLEYIADLIANSLSQGEIDYIESRHLLNILSELNDLEIVWLSLYLNRSAKGTVEFREKHRAILVPRGTFEKAALQASYLDHLERLGLLKPTESFIAKIDRFARNPKNLGHKNTTLGRLLLSRIGISS